MRRRTLIKTTAGLGTVLLAGCSGSDSDSEDGSTASGTFRLLISDQPVAIEDFDSLDVTLSAARVFRADEDEEITPGVVNGTDNTTDDDTEDSEDDESEGVVEFDLDSVTVDLTQVKGDRAVSVLEGELDEGRYSGIELRVASAEGVVDGEAVDVKVPSNRLRIIKPFEIGSDEELDFVFDINVIQKGPTGGYNLLPVIGKSGVAGEDVEVEEVDTDTPEETGAPNGTDTADEDESS
ncbi:DUF4382 domain-containing protein [Natronomonas sp. F2-12]|jgi:hypothetical protein|uniref:DUF4382 domain-containing protein n=1 Tax=Natronomonas aquatica TaxID=2841590 RepID=A0A9R1CTN7_9EURY|nr:DUF4382 domain-containing protein [Natronomonas aquatica]MCQ4335059.1 DUF4382 domain-containing protein [Natronomonas aquatica]